MAKVLSKPKAPELPVVPATPVPTQIVETPTPVIETTPEPTADEVRVQNILTRRRGRLGTIATSIKGVLNDTLAASRKTLLGE